ncbi:uncharacterized protein LOC125236567 [Leguminivora glycinivorella]|uniref:uncharacterized protein LOC125236567 n=1 Tax=Leguminivora glycinivorella TaxID=1035111 RepID=UPI00200BE479|nr:uncharacterized protein LOC125236567 [Leguminivora glycinivorella]
MSFFGKQFKKVKAENALEVIGKLNLSAQTVALLRNPESVSSFTKNADGSIQYVVKDNTGKVVLDEKIVLSALSEYKSPDGVVTKIKFDLQGDVLKSEMHFPDGKIVHMDRHFEANGYKMELYLQGAAEKATVYYEAL